MRRPGLPAFGALFLAAGLGAAPRAADRPNIVWILSEDNSKHYLKLFDDAGAPTPHIEAMANHGVIFEHAFSCSPVCSVARTTLITGCTGPRIGTQFHRKLKLAAMPEGVRMFPAYLREAGYYTSNNRKKDYNAVEGKGVWDASSGKASWRRRPSEETPFFHMQSHGTSHESSLHFSEKQMKRDTLKTDPAKVTLAPYHPDTKLYRYTYARYHDRIRQIDGIVGKLVADLKKDGLLEDTFIFYFGDHGGVLPRSKGYIYESGLHVPLVVRIPENWKDRIDVSLGSRVKGFVSFVDFGPTTLNLAGVSIPKGIDGKPFLGKGVTLDEVNRRDEAFGYADRFDEKYELCRSLRKGRYKYIRNFEAFYPDGLQNNYRYRMLAFEQWRTLYKEGELNAAQQQFFRPKKAEGLYDVEEDPHEIRNLAGDPAHAETLKGMRRRLTDRLKALPDLSLFPENVLVDGAMDNPVAFGRSHKGEIAKLVDVANLALLPFEEARPGLEAALTSKKPWERYWAATACAIFGQQAKPLADTTKRLLEDEALLVRVRAAEFLAIIGAGDPRPVIRKVLQTSESHVETLIALNSVVFLRDGGPGIAFDFSKSDVRSKGGQVGRRIDYLGW